MTRNPWLSSREIVCREFNLQKPLRGNRMTCLASWFQAAALLESIIVWLISGKISSIRARSPLMQTRSPSSGDMFTAKHWKVKLSFSMLSSFRDPMWLLASVWRFIRAFRLNPSLPSRLGFLSSPKSSNLIRFVDKFWAQFLVPFSFGESLLLLLLWCPRSSRDCSSNL